MGLEGEEEEDASERRGFWDGVDLRLGAMMQLMHEGERERERERENQKSSKQLYYQKIKIVRYVCMNM